MVWDEYMCKGATMEISGTPTPTLLIESHALTPGNMLRCSSVVSEANAISSALLLGDVARWWVRRRRIHNRSGVTALASMSSINSN